MCNHDGKRLGIVVGIVGMLLKWKCMDFENLCVCVNLGFDFYQETHFVARYQPQNVFPGKNQIPSWHKHKDSQNPCIFILKAYQQSPRQSQASYHHGYTCFDYSLFFVLSPRLFSYGFHSFILDLSLRRINSSYTCFPKKDFLQVQ
jgi:hypothetical protein